MAVITISRQYGSGGDEIAERVCRILGYQQFDKQQISRAAKETGFSEDDVIHFADYSEGNYKVKRFLDVLLHRSRPRSQKQLKLEEKVVILTAEDQAFSESSALNLVQRAIQAAYLTGNTVIVGRGGQVVLNGKPGVIHVRIEADLEDRIQRVKDHLREHPRDRLEEIALRRAAQDLIAERDTASAAYVYQFYRIDWADRSLYHAILNASRLHIHQASQLIIDMVPCLTM
jgi:CMP/dCMP kinase